MIDGATLLLFLAAAFAINLSPGPSVVFVTSVGARQGPAAGLVAACGLSLGVLGHVLAASLGLSALLLASATAYSLVKMAGAAYLIYLGLTLLIRGAGPAAAPSMARVAWRRLLLKGALIDLLNPKVGLFFLAFLPQFIEPAGGALLAQSLLLGLLFAASGTLVNGAYGVLAGTLLAGPHGRWTALFTRWLPGSLLTALGCRLALEES